MARCESETMLGWEISSDASLPLVTGQYKGNRNLDRSDEDSAGHIVPFAGMGQQNPSRGKEPCICATRRTRKEYGGIVEYIRLNPARRGLVKPAAAWKWSRAIVNSAPVSAKLIMGGVQGRGWKLLADHLTLASNRQPFPMGGCNPD
jgi:hypothetical protein